ncbi:hypothetical protein THRCLA_21738 [Thraustotheca clavata]|uniref:Uncharacterized protein n=1 Tax=Thraustotheca clavata TaxID=74557 RepID=A0A1V9ZQ42_9STRA|nr:hypothetical protein THRCLA_21738 [Thraustotheca clavata]
MRERILDTVVTCVVDNEQIDIVIHERSRALASKHYEPLPQSLFGDVLYGMMSIDPFAFMHAKVSNLDEFIGELGPTISRHEDEMYLKLLDSFLDGQVHNCTFHDMNHTWMARGFLVHFPNRDLSPETFQAREDSFVVLARLLEQVHVWKWCPHQWGDEQHTVIMEILPAFAQLTQLRMQYPSYRFIVAS